MNAVLLISGLMYGGGQKVVLDLLRELGGRDGVDMRLVLLGCREPALERAASQVVPYDGRYNRPATVLQTARRLRGHLIADRPDVLHTHGWDADLIGWLALLGTRTRQVVHLHVTPSWLESGLLRHRVRRFLTRRVLARPGTRTIAVSNAVRGYWCERLPWRSESVSVVHNAVAPEDSVPPVSTIRQESAPPTLGTASRLEPMKGIEYLLDALAMLREEHPDLRLRVAGEGSLEERLQTRTRELGLASNVEFLGHVQDMRPYYNSLDVFALPSLNEGLPRVILESMATGCPVVATTVGGTPEVIRDGQDGLLVPPANAGALAGAIRRLLDDKTLRARLGRSARERVNSQFSITHCADAVLNVYRDRAIEPARR